MLYIYVIILIAYFVLELMWKSLFDRHLLMSLFILRLASPTIELYIYIYMGHNDV